MKKIKQKRPGNPSLGFEPIQCLLFDFNKRICLLLFKMSYFLLKEKATKCDPLVPMSFQSEQLFFMLVSVLFYVLEFIFSIRISCAENVII